MRSIEYAAGHLGTNLIVVKSIRVIESSLEIQKDEEKGLKVIGAIYNIENGTVEFGV